MTPREESLRFVDDLRDVLARGQKIVKNRDDLVASERSGDAEIDRLQSLLGISHDTIADLEKKNTASHIDHQMFKANLDLLTELDEAKRTSVGHWDAYMKAARERDAAFHATEHERQLRVLSSEETRLAHETIRLITRDGEPQQRHLDLIEEIHTRYTE